MLPAAHLLYVCIHRAQEQAARNSFSFCVQSSTRFYDQSTNNLGARAEHN
jgi:hypothetical protein